MTKPKSPITFGNFGSELNDLNDRITYWWFTKANPGKALGYSKNFSRLLQRRGHDDGSIALQEHWGLLYQVQGRIGRAIACREREIALIARALRVGGPIGPIDYKHLATRLQGLIDLCVQNGEAAKATRARRKLQQLVRTHRLDVRGDREPPQEQTTETEPGSSIPESYSVERCQRDCEPLIVRGLKLHASERFAAGLSCFERLLRISPQCAFAMYNQANTMHSLGRDKEAEGPLRELIQATPEELFEHCPASNLRSVQVDAHFLLFRVLIYGRGFSEEAFAFAEKHVSLRRRGVRSVWSAQEIRANIAAMRRAWKAGVKLKGPAPPVSDLGIGNK